MSSEKLKICAIYGSTGEGPFGNVLGDWLPSLMPHHDDISIEALDPRAFEISIRHNPDTPTATKSCKALAQTDAFIVLVPQYNHSYPAALKAMIDLAYTVWQAKPVGFVSYGSVAGGLRAVEHLRQVFAELHMGRIRDGVSFPNARPCLDKNGKFDPPAKALAALHLVLTKLTWWSQTLKAARIAQPYEKAA